MKAREIVVAIPIYGQLELVKRCVRSVLRNTPKEGVRLLLINDASPGLSMRAWLHEVFLVRDRDLVLVQNTERKGFAQSANFAIQEALARRSDLVLLNSDTEVPQGWLERLSSARITAEDAGERVAAVCPVSDNATIFSVPNAGPNVLPPYLSTEQVDALVFQAASHAGLREYLNVPTCVGFCMLLTWEAMQSIGFFGAEFGLGYGEEVDWCQRAGAAGFECLLAPYLFVRHQEHGSFGNTEERKALRSRAADLVARRWPAYSNEVRVWALSGVLFEMRLRLLLSIMRESSGPFKLWVLHSYGPLGGVESSVRRAIREDTSHRHAVLHPRCVNPTDVTLEVDEDGTLVIAISPQLMGHPMISSGFGFGGKKSTSLWTHTVKRVLDPDAISIQHLAGWSCLSDWALAASTSDEVVLHDEYWICPIFRLGGECQKVRATATDDCVRCLRDHSTLREPMTDLEIGRVLAAWELAAVQVLRSPVKVVSESLARRLDLGSNAIITAHVREVEEVPNVRCASGKRRVAFVGSFCDVKGAEAFIEAAKNTTDSYEWFILGPLGGTALNIPEHVTCLGAYRPQDLAFWLQRFDVVVPAVARNEAWGLVIDECLASNCKVLLPAIDVVRERGECGALLYQWGSWASLLQSVEISHAV